LLCEAAATSTRKRPPASAVLKAFVTKREVALEAFDFVEGFYNPRRRHTSIGNISAEFEERMTSAAYKAVHTSASRRRNAICRPHPAAFRAKNRLKSRSCVGFSVAAAEGWGALAK